MNTNKSISVMKSFDFQCDFSFDFAWQQDYGSFVLCADNCSPLSLREQGYSSLQLLIEQSRLCTVQCTQAVLFYQKGGSSNANNQYGSNRRKYKISH
jgi:hypothetical protein